MIACLEDILTDVKQSTILWGPKPAPELSVYIFSQCESTMVFVIDGYNEMMVLNYVGVSFLSLVVIITTADLNPNLNTASSNYC